MTRRPAGGFSYSLVGHLGRWDQPHVESFLPRAPPVLVQVLKPPFARWRVLRVCVERANRDLAKSLDPSQQAAQPRPIDNGLWPPASRGNDFARRATAIADRAEQDAIAAARRNAVENGKWLDAEEAARVWQGELARVIAETETFLLTTLARELADKYGLDWKAVSLDIRKLFRVPSAP